MILFVCTCLASVISLSVYQLFICSFHLIGSLSYWFFIFLFHLNTICLAQLFPLFPLSLSLSVSMLPFPGYPLPLCLLTPAVPTHFFLKDSLLFKLSLHACIMTQLCLNRNLIMQLAPLWFIYLVISEESGLRFSKSYLNKFNIKFIPLHNVYCTTLCCSITQIGEKKDKIVVVTKLKNSEQIWIDLEDTIKCKMVCKSFFFFSLPQSNRFTSKEADFSQMFLIFARKDAYCLLSLTTICLLPVKMLHN